jgi:hypothetical protein
MNKNLITYAILGAGAYWIYKNRKPKRTGKIIIEPLEKLSEAEFNKTDAVIDADAKGINLTDAIEKAKDIVSQIKDAKIDILHKGKKSTIRAGRKKVKLTKENKEFFKKIKNKKGRRLSTKQQKDVKLALTTFKYR